MNFSPTRSSSTNNNSHRIVVGGGGSPGHSFMSATGTSAKYIYDLPYLERKELCRILDENNQWEMLGTVIQYAGGGLMCYTSSELSEFSRAVYRGSSPTDALLTAWGSQNHTILELFTLLGRLHHFRGMRLLANFVDPKYHVFIRDSGGVNVTAELIQLEAAAAQPLLPEPKVQNVVPDKPSPGEGEDKNKNLEAEKKLKEGAIAESIGLLPSIPYQELLIATDNWERRNILGKGGFGTVFRGMWKNTAVAIKRMEQRANQAYAQSQFKQSLGELRFLNSYRHDNVLPLYGYCIEGEHLSIVYQYMVNGSLEDRLLCRQRTYPLNWTTRFNITRGVACGIQFLHSIGAQPLIHGDIKSANILLDKNFEAKVGDFGLAREMSPSSAGASYVKVSRVHGTRPYLPDEYLRSKKLSTKVDTFSFGIMLFEIMTGMRAYEESRQKKYLKDMFDEAENPEVLKDQRGGPDNPDVFWILIKSAKACTVRVAKERPEMVQVLKSLEGFMSQASLRTVSSHVTGLPLLFETRAGSLMPTGTSTTHRLSPVEMRTPSPHWIPPNHNTHNTPNQTPRQVLDSVASVRRSPLPSARSPLPVPAQTMTSQPVSIPEPTTHSNNHNQSVPTPPAVIHHMNIVGSPEAPQPQPPQQLVQVSPPVVPVMVDSYFPAVLPDDDQYFPLVLNKSEDSTAQESDADGDTDGPATVIPLITELGIKD